jgi:hypothetical protein
MKGLITIIFVLICINAFPCECRYSQFDSDAVNSVYIFSGLIISKENNINKIMDKPFYPPVKYRVVIHDRWKGELKDTIDLYSGLGGPDCGFEFDVNKSYIIWATIDRYGLLSTDRCGRTCLLDDSPDIDRLNNRFKGLTYDSTYLTKNEITVLKKRIRNDSIDLSKTVLFVDNDKLLSKKELIDALINQRQIEFHSFSPDKQKLLPNKAVNGVLVVKDYDSQKINMNKIIKTIKKPSR